MGSRKTRKQKIAAEVRNQKVREAQLLKFLIDYGQPEPPQEVAKALFDNQIKSIFIFLAEILNNNNSGTIVDIGCGNGTILSRLADLINFKEKSEWSYLGIDYNEYKEPVVSLAVNNKLHRKVDFLSLDDFYKEWPNDPQLKRQHLVFIRNVLHELSIEETSILFSHIINNLFLGEKLVIQDLLVFPKAEKGNVCWEPDTLVNLLENCGFSVVMTIEQSKYGGRWINIIATLTTKHDYDLSKIKALVIKFRLLQWNKWKKLGALHQDDEQFRDVIVSKIDFDLQFASLNAQLIDSKAKGVSPLQPEQEALVLKETFDQTLNSFNLVKPQNILELVESVPYFVNRGNSKDGLEKFLVSSEKVTVIQGPPLMGKTELVKEVLSKFHHNRYPVFIDVQATYSVWNIVEGILGSIRCHIPIPVLRSLRSTDFTEIKDVLLDTLKRFSNEIILVFDHFERILNPGGLISDREIKDFLISVSATDAKIILTSTKQIDLSIFPPEYVFQEIQPPVGRFPDGPPHVGQLLGILAGIKECPDDILKSIDRHPLLAVLVGLCIRKYGVAVLSDDNFIKDIKSDLRSAILNRISDDISKPALNAISHLRISVPREMLNKLSSSISVKSAEEIGLIYSVRDSSRDDLLSCIGAIRYWDKDEKEDLDDNELEQAENADKINIHENIYHEYLEVYRKDDDPKWLREIYFHKLISGNKDAVDNFGSYFRSEIFGAGEYWFRYKKDFDSAYWAFSIASKYGENSLFLRMRTASCLIRIKKRREGEEMFDKLIKEFPRAMHIVSSYVDSLIYINAFGAALSILNKYQITSTDNEWHAGQFGRIYMGLHNYPEAITAFKYQLYFGEMPIIYQNLARAYHKMGDTPNQMAMLEKGLKIFPNSKRLNVAMASLYEKIGKTENAKEILLKMHNENPYNGWVLFPLFKVLARSDETEKALSIFKKVNNKIDPTFLRKTIESEIEVIKGNYQTAINILDSQIQDEHSVGQKLEAYFAWASSVDDIEEGIQIAKEGLSLKINKELKNNVPTLFSVGKLAILARDYEQYKKIQKHITDINPELKDLQDFARQIKPEWL